MSSLDLNTTSLVGQQQQLQAQKLKGKVSESIDENLYNELGLTHKDKTANKNSASEIGDFMTLFLAQLKNQDPLNPQDGADFVAQLAQFNTVEGVQKLNSTVSNMSESIRSGRILEATGMIGKQIEVPTGKMFLTSNKISDTEIEFEPIRGVYKIPDINVGHKKGEAINHISDMKVTVTNPLTGEVVQQQSFGPQISGREVPLIWDGTDGKGHRLTDKAGHPIPDGEYKISAQVLVGKDWLPVDTIIGTTVDSVAINQDSGEITLNAAGVGSITLSELKRVSQPNRDIALANNDTEKVEESEVNEVDAISNIDSEETENGS